MSPLLLPIIISICAGFLIFLVPQRYRRAIEIFSLGISAYLFGASLCIFLCKAVYIGKGYIFLDPFSKFILLGIGFFGFLVTLYSSQFMAASKRFKIYYAGIIWTIGFSMLTVMTSNMALFLVSWGSLGFIFYLLINTSGSDSSKAANKALMMMAGSDTLMILGFVIIWSITGSLNFADTRIDIDNGLSLFAFLLLAVGAFAKAGVMPFHTWIPDAAKDSPIPVTALLPASIDKLLGIYLLARLVNNIFILNNYIYAFLMIIGTITIICAVMMALVQHNFKRLLGYHAVSQMGYMVLGIGTGNPIGMAGALFHMLNNAMYKTSLFLSVGNVEYKTKTSELDSLGGLGKSMPLTFISVLMASCAISGIPPFNGFVSKWMIYQGLIENGRSGGVLWIFCLMLAMFASGLTLASFIKLIHAVFLGRPHDDARRAERDEVKWPMWLPPMVLAALCLAFGIFSYHIPMKYFILPSISEGVSYTGTWLSLKTTLFLFIGFVVGIVIYFMGNIKGIRITDTYIGGEDVEKNMALSGTEFYNTIKEFGLLKWMFSKAEAGFFDIYVQLKRCIFLFVGLFKYLHNGVLPSYLVWCLLGIMALLFGIVRF